MAKSTPALLPGMPSSKACVLFVTLALLWYNGVDVIPGSLDESSPSADQLSTDLSITDIFEGRDQLIRLQRPNGLAVSEEDEAKLLPLLEDLEAGVEALELQAVGVTKLSFRQKKWIAAINTTRASLKALEILSDSHIDGMLTKKDVANVIEQMGATVGWRRHFFRFSLALLFIAAPGGGGRFQQALFIELFLIFLPYGHPVTTAGRHFEGARTWAGLRRMDYGLFLLLQGALVYFISRDSIQKKTTFKKQKSKILRGIDVIYSIGSAAFFGWVGNGMYSAAPDGWAMYGNIGGGINDTGAPKECAAEFTMAVAEQMHLCYLGFLVASLANSVLDQLKSARAPWATLSRGKQDHWFWFLVMYFSPYEDAAVPMMMACVRQVAADLANIVGLENLNQHFISPSTTLVELVYFLVTVMSGCHWPLVLWLRVPTLFEGALAFLQNCRYVADGLVGGSGGWVTRNAKWTEVTIFYPCSQFGSGNGNVESLHRKPGYWIRKTVEVMLEPDPMSLGSNPAGAMRDVYHMLDPKGAILSHPLVASALAGLNVSDKRKLVYKKYRDANSAIDRMYGGVDGLYFSDVHMQFEAACLAKMWNSNAPANAGEMMYAPAFVMKVEATGEVFGVECFLEGAYVKWNSNGLFPETFMRGADDAPTAFCHFTHDATGGEKLVCDIQGVKKRSTTVSPSGVGPAQKDANRAQGGNRFVLTDPQIHTPRGLGGGDTAFGVGNLGSEGIQKFFQGHRCGACCNSLNLTHTMSKQRQREFDNELESVFERGRKISLGIVLLIIIVWIVYTMMQGVYHLNLR